MLFPLAFPQLTRLVTGQAPTSPEFLADRRAFLVGVGFAPLLVARRAPASREASTLRVEAGGRSALGRLRQRLGARSLEPPARHRDGAQLPGPALAPLFFWAVEHHRSADVHSIGDAYGWLARTLFENTSPYKLKSQFGFVSYWIVRVAGVSLVAFGTATIASRFVATVIKRGAGMGTFKGSGHILICGWSSKGPEIIRELRAREVEDDARDRDPRRPRDRSARKKRRRLHTRQHERRGPTCCAPASTVCRP